MGVKTERRMRGDGGTEREINREGKYLENLGQKGKKKRLKMIKT